MKLISYDEFSLLENYIGQENFDILLEKNLTSEIDKKIKFGVVMATHKISDGGGNRKTKIYEYTFHFKRFFNFYKKSKL